MWVVLENICWLREGGGIIAQELESFVEQTIFNVIETYQYTFQATISFECEGLPLRSLEKQSGHGMGWARAKQRRCDHFARHGLVERVLKLASCQCAFPKS